MASWGRSGEGGFLGILAGFGGFARFGVWPLVI
jgi:hypothetical protein